VERGPDGGPRSAPPALAPGAAHRALLDEGSLAEPPRRPGLELAVALGSIATLALFAPGAAAARSASPARPHPAPPLFLLRS
jgi:hypothetical protein